MSTTSILRRVVGEHDGDPERVIATLEKTAGRDGTTALWIVRKRLKKNPEATRLVFGRQGFLEAQ